MTLYEEEEERALSAYIKQRSVSMRLRVFVQDAVSGTSFAIEGEGRSAQEVVDSYNRALKEGEPKITAVTAVQLDAPVEVVGEPDEDAD